jgi:LPPG:FO 2-phospho-L-lactate transferase
VIAVLCGGVGAARFLDGLVRVVDPADVTAIVNVGDDFDAYGLRVCPDSDIVTYTLAGAIHAERGFGLKGDTLRVVEALRRLGVDAWFGLGDADFATAIYRTQRLAAGGPLHEIAGSIAAAYGVRTRILPVTNQPVRTRVRIEGGEWLDFQEYFVHRRNEPAVEALRYEGAEHASPAPGVLDAIASAEVVFIAPSNPFLSVHPLLAVEGVEEAVRATSAPVVAISPIVGGRAIKGPADRMLKSLGHEPSAEAVARIYGDLLDGYVYDEVDAPIDVAMPALATNTLMTDVTARERLAGAALYFARSLR